MFGLKRLEKLRPHLWSQPPAQNWPDTSKVVKSLARQWDAYLAAPLDIVVTEHDDMLAAGEGSIDNYNKVGLSALQMISEAMLASGRCGFDHILDLPCGGGRITRHLRAFFPDSQIYVADIDKNKERAVADQFQAERYAFSPDFNESAESRFDFIFSGSLLTHFDRDMFERALDYFIGSLRPGGIAILTLHGRTSASHSLEPHTMQNLLIAKGEFIRHFKKIKRRPKFNIDPERAIGKDFVESGFGYFANPAWTDMYQRSYGGSYTTPAWIMEQIQARSDCLILGYKEQGFGGVQDVVCIQRL